jgi:hypothetical protein
MGSSASESGAPLKRTLMRRARETVERGENSFIVIF